MTTRIFPSLTLWLALAAGCLQAQPPRAYFPWWSSPLSRDINLTPNQRRQVREVVHEYRNKLIDARAAVQKAEADVEDLFNDDQIDSRRAGEAVDRLVVARGELTRSFAQMSLKLRTVLTTQQWRELCRRQQQQPPKPSQPGRQARPPAGKF